MIPGDECPPSLHYADRPPAGYRMLDDQTPARAGDMVYRGLIGGRWTLVRFGQNIVGATRDDLFGATSVLALARLITNETEPAEVRPLSAPCAVVPVHPRHGRLWANVRAYGAETPLPSYPLDLLYDQAAIDATVAAERERWLRAATAALELLDDLPAWSNAGHACQLLREAMGLNV